VVLAQTSTSKQDAALFAEMLSLPNDGRYPALDPAARALGGAADSLIGPVQAFRAGVSTLNGPRLR
jgi:hypothetical protein